MDVDRRARCRPIRTRAPHKESRSRDCCPPDPPGLFGKAQTEIAEVAEPPEKLEWEAAPFRRTPRRWARSPWRRIPERCAAALVGPLTDRSRTSAIALSPLESAGRAFFIEKGPNAFVMVFGLDAVHLRENLVVELGIAVEVERPPYRALRVGERDRRSLNATAKSAHRHCSVEPVTRGDDTMNEPELASASSARIELASHHHLRRGAEGDEPRQVVAGGHVAAGEADPDERAHPGESLRAATRKSEADGQSEAAPPTVSPWSFERSPGCRGPRCGATGSR